MSKHETYMTPSVRAFAGEPSERLDALVSDAEQMTPERKREIAAQKLDAACGITPTPTPEERAEQRLQKVARGLGYSSIQEMENDIADLEDDDNDSD